MAITNLHILFIDGATFQTIPVNKKAVFRVFLDNQNKLTLGLWSGTDTDYDPVASKLDIGRSANFDWPQGTYLGDQKIGKVKIQEIKNAITPASPLVIFIPQLDTAITDQVIYKIFVGRQSDTLLPDFALLTPVGFTNPSPPRHGKVN